MSSARSEAAQPGAPEHPSILEILQRIGKSLMLPIAVLPAAGLLLRLGQGDLLGQLGQTAPGAADGPLSILSKAGSAIFTNLPIIFALGVAIGFAKKSDGSTALAAGVGYLVFKNVLTYQAFNVSEDPATFVAPDPGVIGGIVMGVTTALLWEAYHLTELRPALAFFSGRRLVPMLSAFAGILWGIVFGFVWPTMGHLLNGLATWMYAHGPLGAGLYGLLNRVLIPTGLHHILNTFVWFQAGTCQTHSGVAHGDLTCFFNATTDQGKYGLFMTGFFPIFMFALPAAAFAMLAEAKDRTAAAILPAAAVVAFLTGLAEPLEFTFMFVAPVLYGFHAVMTGLSLALSYALGARSGFGFSAGAMDFLLNLGISTRPWVIVLLGLVFAVIYYVVFRAVIRRFNLRTPGREGDDGPAAGTSS